MTGSDKNISIFISLILRHKPEVAGVKLDKYGYADVTELLTGINNTGKHIDIELLEKIVSEDNKQRYKFNREHTKIRANQGHSIGIDLELAGKKPPHLLYHGTSEGAVDNIFKEGILKQERDHVHLSSEVNTAIIVGKRHGKPVVLSVDTKRMYEDGFKFGLSDNNVWLTTKVPSDYISIVTIRNKGEAEGMTKNIPTKVINKERYVSSGYTARWTDCPNCKKTIGGSYKQTECIHCGQQILWK